MEKKYTLEEAYVLLHDRIKEIKELDILLIELNEKLNKVGIRPMSAKEIFVLQDRMIEKVKELQFGLDQVINKSLQELDGAIFVQKGT